MKEKVELVSVIDESPIDWAPVNLAKTLVVPPTEVTPPDPEEQVTTWLLPLTQSCDPPPALVLFNVTVDEVVRVVVDTPVAPVITPAEEIEIDGVFKKFV